MFDHYGHKYICNFRIYSADDDSSEYSATQVHIYSTYSIDNLDRSRTNGRSYLPIVESDVYPNNITADAIVRTINCQLQQRAYTKGEPLMIELKNVLQTVLGWGSRTRRYSNSPLEFKMAFVLPESGMAVMVEKGQTYYKMMNQRVRKKNLLFAIARYIYRSCFEKEPQPLLEYVLRMITMPENITYVLENRTPFYYFNIKDREKVNCRLNTMLISNTEAAIEISDGIWAPISIPDLDIMVNYFYHEHARAKSWANTTPKKLWTRLMGKEPTDSQLQLMEEFLVQNRTSDMVESRAKELMNSLEVKYPNRIKILDAIGANKVKYKVMIVRGKLADWVIINSAYKTETQKVKTYIFINQNALGKSIKKHNIEELNGHFSGPICIDNIHSNSSLGDQYAARALALLNDKLTVKLVNTIGRYVPQDVLDGKIESRLSIDWEDLENAEYNWGAMIA